MFLVCTCRHYWTMTLTIVVRRRGPLQQRSREIAEDKMLSKLKSEPCMRKEQVVESLFVCED